MHKRCPFCNSTNVTWVTTENTMCMYCCKCKAQGPSIQTQNPFSKELDDIIEVEKLWNTRK